MYLYELEEKLENYIDMHKEDVEDFLYEELDDYIENVIDNEDDTITFVCNNFQITLHYYKDDISNIATLESYDVEVL